MEPSAGSLPGEHPPSTSRRQLRRCLESPSGCHKQQGQKKSEHVPTELRSSHSSAYGHLPGVERGRRGGDICESQHIRAQGTCTCRHFISSFLQGLWILNPLSLHRPLPASVPQRGSPQITTILRQTGAEPPLAEDLIEQPGQRVQPEQSSLTPVSTAGLLHLRSKRRVLVISSQKTKTAHGELSSLKLCQSCE